MRVMLDTNVIISMIFFPSVNFKRMMKDISDRHQLVLSSFILDEIIEISDRKFPKRKDDVDRFLSNLSYEFVYTPRKIKAGLFAIRDINDYPILYTAIVESVDLFITGDKDFFDVDIEKPEILTPTMYIEKFIDF